MGRTWRGMNAKSAIAGLRVTGASGGMAAVDLRVTSVGGAGATAVAVSSAGTSEPNRLEAPSAGQATPGALAFSSSRSSMSITPSLLHPRPFFPQPQYGSRMFASTSFLVPVSMSARRSSSCWVNFARIAIAITSSRLPENAPSGPSHILLPTKPTRERPRALVLPGVLAARIAARWASSVNLAAW